MDWVRGSPADGSVVASRGDSCAGDPSVTCGPAPGAGEGFASCWAVVKVTITTDASPAHTDRGSTSERRQPPKTSDGKLVIQGRNCMNCHTLLGNGAYYAPDLTKAWLDQGWGAESVRENLMVTFLLDPEANARTFGTGRKMPNLDLTQEEAEAVVAYLKWMSSIDTNGFPRGFTPIAQEPMKQEGGS